MAWGGVRAMLNFGESVAVGFALGVLLGSGAALLGVFVGLRMVGRWWQALIERK